MLLLAAALQAGGAEPLDIYFEESHAGSFYHLAATLPLDEPHTLVLIDAHSDASAVAGSDTVREAIRKVPTVEAREALLAGWRQRGTIQCFDWIEPLMPAPFARVLWVAAPRLSPIERGRRQTLAREYLDGLQEAFPRVCGELGGRYTVADWAGFTKQFPAGPRDGRVVVSLDLDYFAATPATALDAEFARVFAGVLAVPGLRALTFSLSSPWLRDAGQAERLTTLALSAATSVANGRVFFAPSAITGEDRSRRAGELRRAGKPVPCLDLTQAGAGLRSLLLARREKFAPDSALEALLDEWQQDPFLPRAAVSGEVSAPDGWHRLTAQHEFFLTVTNSGGAPVRWFALVPEHASTNVAALELGFADDAPRWLRRVPRLIGEGAGLSSRALAAVLEPATHAGTALVYAEVEREGEAVRSNELRLAFHIAAPAGADFRAALSELFARPYAFGCGMVAGGPDGLVANDCANFMVGALRRQGWLIPWCNPKQFATHCRELASWKRGGTFPAIPPGSVDSGVFVHFGSHVAALWEDLPPLGQLGENDLVAHHLEGLPEVVPLGTLLRTRDGFRLMQFRPPGDAVTLVFGGDVMLGRKVGETIERGGDPLAALSPVLRAADLAVVNLECVASPLGQAVPGHTYHFRAHASAPGLLAAAGVDVVSLANNHARDFGDAAFSDAADRLRAAQVQVADGSARPVRQTIAGLPLAIFACQDEVDENFLTAAGARLVVGSGPHTRQPLTIDDGSLIAWSLGNLVFDGPGPDPGWSRGALLAVTLTREGRIVRARELPVQIADDGQAMECASPLALSIGRR